MASFTVYLGELPDIYPTDEGHLVPVHTSVDSGAMISLVRWLRINFIQEKLYGIQLAYSANAFTHEPCHSPPALLHKIGKGLVTFEQFLAVVCHAYYLAYVQQVYNTGPGIHFCSVYHNNYFNAKKCKKLLLKLEACFKQLDTKF